MYNTLFSPSMYRLMIKVDASYLLFFFFIILAGVKIQTFNLLLNNIYLNQLSYF